MDGNLFLEYNIGVFVCLVVNIKIVKDDGDCFVLAYLFVVVLCIGYIHDGKNRSEEECEDF